MTFNDIRYKQRFENFEKSFLLLEQALSIKEPSIVEKAGTIQFFEISFELSWKLMKDYLSYLGYEVKSPREAIKTAFSIDLITDADIWLSGLIDRNLTVHTYDEAKADEVFNLIKEVYYQLICSFYKTFKERQLCMD